MKKGFSLLCMVIISTVVLSRTVYGFELAGGDGSYTEQLLPVQLYIHEQGWETAVDLAEDMDEENSDRYPEAIMLVQDGLFSRPDLHYGVYVQEAGWQEMVSCGEVSCPIGNNRHLEALKIELGETASMQYDVEYRVYIRSLGWLDWARNGEVTGAAGLGAPIQNLEVRLLKKELLSGYSIERDTEEEQDSEERCTEITIPRLTGKTYIRGDGWEEYAIAGLTMGDIVGVNGIESFLLQWEQNPSSLNGELEYCAYYRDSGWNSDWNQTGEICGTEGNGRNIEAVRIRLTGELERFFDINYRVYSKRFGWLGWTSNGEPAGTSDGVSYLSGMQVFLSVKDSRLRDSDTSAFNVQRDLYWSVASIPETEEIVGFGGYELGSVRRSQLEKAIGELKNYKCGFVMIDTQTGKGVAYQADQEFYSASSIKGHFVLSLCANNAQAIKKSEGTIKSVLQYSSNEGYDGLFNTYGGKYFEQWQSEAGVSLKESMRGHYAMYTPRTFCRLWIRNWEFFEADETGDLVGSWMQKPNASAIHEALGEKYVTRSKAGWIGSSFVATCDGGVVYSESPYIITIMSDVPANMKRLYPIIEVLDKIHEEM
ncbi:MAG: hypothetical protein Q4B22_03885 [Eubacteriales bacterium]|nr:hypothetical protein [Eubacteriales bacterium]